MNIHDSESDSSDSSSSESENDEVDNNNEALPKTPKTTKPSNKKTAARKLCDISPFKEIVGKDLAEKLKPTSNDNEPYYPGPSKINNPKNSQGPSNVDRPNNNQNPDVIPTEVENSTLSNYDFTKYFDKIDSWASTCARFDGVFTLGLHNLSVPIARQIRQPKEKWTKL